jgi:hypothetical protein
MFRLPASALVAERLREALLELGAAVEVAEGMTSEAAWAAWARTLWSERRGELLLTAGGGLAAMTVFHGPGPVFLWMALAGGLAAVDVRGFRRRITLSPAVLSRRLGLAPGTLVRPAAALLRRAQSLPLRETLAAALTEHARLLAAVSRAFSSHPALQPPFREALDEVGEHTLRAAENAVVIEEASSTSDRDDLPTRLAHLRALGNEETTRQLRALLTSREQRQLREDWLRRTHALLLIRLEAITERLRSLRQETAQRLLETTAPAAATDRSLSALARELELAASSLAEAERDLPERLPEVIAQIVDRA